MTQLPQFTWDVDPVFLRVPKEIVTIMQGVTVLSVVIAYELVRRFSLVQQQRRVGAELRAAAGTPAAGEGSPA